jgi:parallel beta-helix repeat protein
MKRASYLAATAAIALLGFAAPANATHGDGLQCGDTIETANSTVVLQGDIQCPSSFTAYAFLITADNVTLRMDGHRVLAGTPGLGGDAIMGGSEADPLSGIRIYGGIIEGTDPDRSGFVNGGVTLIADDSYVFGTRITSRGGGINLYGDRNQAHVNTLEITGDGYGGRLGIFGDDAHVTRNTVTGFPQTGILVGSTFGQTADRPRVAVNTIQCSPSIFGGTGVEVTGYTGMAVIGRDNVVTGCSIGITVQAADTGSPKAFVRRNTTNGNGFGLSVHDPAAFIWRNTANNNTSDGIGISKSGNTVQENTANNNGQVGINAPIGTIDGGGNTATGNSAANCLNVSCGP